MGRTGIGAHAIHEAAAKLQAKGRTPTVDSVRESLGTGSKTTIANHLRDWKAEQGAGLGNLPAGLQKSVAALWESLQIEATERIHQGELSHKAEKAQWQSEMALLQQEKIELMNQLHQAEDDRIANLQKYQTLEEKYAKLQEECLTLRAQYQANCQQLENMKTDNTRLHQLAANIQNNLEHYQQSIQQLHAEHALNTEKQQAHSQQEIQTLRTTLSSVKAELRHEVQRSLELNRMAEKSKLEIIDLNNRLKTADGAEKEILLLKERYAEQNKKSQELSQNLDQKEQRLIDTHSQLATLNQKIQELTLKVSAADDTIERLRHEKLFLAQEKSELLGQLKQLEKMHSAKNGTNLPK
jgi:hypothetical protein